MPTSDEDASDWQTPRLSIWCDRLGIAHWALLKREGTDPWLIDAFTPCEGYIGAALAYNELSLADGAVTCFACMTSKFVDNVEVMNTHLIDHLDDHDVLEFFVDHDAMGVWFDA